MDIKEFKAKFENLPFQSRVIRQYRITYENGMQQEKDLINHDDFETIIKPAEDLIYDMIKESGGKENSKVKNMKVKLKKMFGGNWFTDKSPIFEASITGRITLPGDPSQSKPCKVESILYLL